MKKSKILVQYYEKKGAGDTPRIQQRSLDEVVISLLAGVGRVTPDAFIRIAQRAILTLRNVHVLTQIAVSAGQPGLELKDPEAIKLPEDISPSESTAIKSMARRVAKMLDEIRIDMEAVVASLPQKDGAVLLPEAAVQINLGELYQVILDEAAALVTAGSTDDISADFSLVLGGLAILIKNTKSIEALNLPLSLIDKFPLRKGEIISTLLPHCSIAQRKELIKLERGPV